MGLITLGSLPVGTKFQFADEDDGYTIFMKLSRNIDMETNPIQCFENCHPVVVIDNPRDIWNIGMVFSVNIAQLVREVQ